MGRLSERLARIEAVTVPQRSDELRRGLEAIYAEMGGPGDPEAIAIVRRVDGWHE
jgi:hypothetical protein